MVWRLKNSVRLSSVNAEGLVVLKHLVFTFFFLILSSLYAPLQAQTLSPLTPLNQLEDLLFLSLDQQLLYFRRNNQQLTLKKMTKEFTLLTPKASSVKNPTPTEYEVYSSWVGKKVVVKQLVGGFEQVNLNKSGEIFLSDLGASELLFIDRGERPRLLLNDSWLSYYQPETSTLKLKFLNLLASKNDASSHIELKLNAPGQSGFLPRVEMLSYDTVLYTDINNIGVMSLISYEVGKKNFIFLHQSILGSTLDFCLLKQTLYLRETNGQQTLLYKLTWEKGLILPKKELIDQIATNSKNTNQQFTSKALGPVCAPFEKKMPLMLYANDQLSFYDEKGFPLKKKNLLGYTGFFTNHQLIYLEKEGSYEILKP